MDTKIDVGDSVHIIYGEDQTKQVRGLFKVSPQLLLVSFTHKNVWLYDVEKKKKVCEWENESYSSMYSPVMVSKTSFMLGSDAKEVVGLEICGLGEEKTSIREHFRLSTGGFAQRLVKLSIPDRVVVVSYCRPLQYISFSKKQIVKECSTKSDHGWSFVGLILSKSNPFCFYFADQSESRILLINYENDGDEVLKSIRIGGYQAYSIETFMRGGDEIIVIGTRLGKMLFFNSRTEEMIHKLETVEVRTLKIQNNMLFFGGRSAELTENGLRCVNLSNDKLTICTFFKQDLEGGSKQHVNVIEVVGIMNDRSVRLAAGYEDGFRLVTVSSDMFRFVEEKKDIDEEERVEYVRFEENGYMNFGLILSNGSFKVNKILMYL